MVRVPLGLGRHTSLWRVAPEANGEVVFVGMDGYAPSPKLPHGLARRDTAHSCES